MEAVLTTTLVGFGATRGAAILGVVTWRLVNFWLPIPAGAAAYLSLRLGSDPRKGRRAAELRRLGSDAQAQAEPASRWARRHGLGVPEPD
jgi:hypothetical protein